MREDLVKKFNKFYPRLYSLRPRIECQGPKEHIKYLDFHKKRYLQTIKILDRLGCNPSSRVLEIGVAYLSILIKEVFGCEIHGIDRHFGYQKILEEYNIPLKQCNLLKNQIPYFGGFDFVLLCEVLEHLPMPPIELFEKLRKVVGEGFLLITTPNLTALAKRLKLLLGKSPLDIFKITPYGEYTHLREYTLNELVNCLEDSGYQIVQKNIIQSWKHRLDIIFSFFYFFPSLRDNLFIVAKLK